MTEKQYETKTVTFGIQPFQFENDVVPIVALGIDREEKLVIRFSEPFMDNADDETLQAGPASAVIELLEAAGYKVTKSETKKSKKSPRA